MAFFKSQHIVKAKFSFALLHQKAVGIKHKNYRKQGYYRNSNEHKKRKIVSSVNGAHSFIFVKGIDNIKRAEQTCLC